MASADGERQILATPFATLGLDAGADVLDVAAMLGHSSPAITQAVYQHPRSERLRTASEAIEGAIFS